MKRWLLAFVLLCSPLLGAGQNSPAFRQFYFNPFLFNPAYAGIDGFTDVFVFHRQQWLNFNNAPFASGFSIQYPTQRKASFGFSFSNQEVVALRNTSASITFAYRIPISANQFIFFGISGGMGSNNLKIDELDYANDPAIINALDNSIYADGNFGALYTLGRLRIGFSLPRLFGQPNFSPQGLGQIEYSQLRNQLYSASYKFYFGSGNFALEPYFLYRLNRDNQNFWEAASLLYFKDKIWVGGSYHETQGLGFFLGMDFKEKLRFAYSYELPPVSQAFISVSSHELHLQFRLGKKRVFKWALKSDPLPAKVVSMQPDTVSANNLLPDNVVVPSEDQTGEPRKSAEPLNTPVTIDEPVVQAEVKVQKTEDNVATDQLIQSAPPRQAVMATGFYLIVASLDNLQNGLQEKNRFVSLGFTDAYLAQNPANKRYYVYIFSSLSVEAAREARDHYRSMSVTRDAWILKID